MGSGVVIIVLILQFTSGESNRDHKVDFASKPEIVSHVTRWGSEITSMTSEFNKIKLGDSFEAMHIPALSKIQENCPGSEESVTREWIRNALLGSPPSLIGPLRDIQSVKLTKTHCESDEKYHISASIEKWNRFEADQISMYTITCLTRPYL